MVQPGNGIVQVLFKFYSVVLGEDAVEKIWAYPIDEDKRHYQLANIPFYAPYAYGDIVQATYNSTDKMLLFENVLQHSGNSTIMVVMLHDTGMAEGIRNAFHALLCTTETFGPGYFVINIPAAVDYTPIKTKLKALQQNEVLDFAELSISPRHG